MLLVRNWVNFKCRKVAYACQNITPGFSVISGLRNMLSVVNQPDNENQLARWLTSLVASTTTFCSRCLCSLDKLTKLFKGSVNTEENTHFGFWSSSDKSPIVDTKSGNLLRLFVNIHHQTSNPHGIASLAFTERSAASWLTVLRNESSHVFGRRV